MSDPDWPSDMRVVTGGDVGDAPPPPPPAPRRRPPAVDRRSAGSAGPIVLPAGQQAWARMNVYAPVPCPTDLGIAFTVGYSLNGQAYTLPVTSPDPGRVACAGS